MLVSFKPLSGFRLLFIKTISGEHSSVSLWKFSNINVEIYRLIFLLFNKFNKVNAFDFSWNRLDCFDDKNSDCAVNYKSLFYSHFKEFCRRLIFLLVVCTTCRHGHLYRCYVSLTNKYFLNWTSSCFYDCS